MSTLFKLNDLSGGIEIELIDTADEPDVLGDWRHLQYILFATATNDWATGIEEALYIPKDATSIKESIDRFISKLESRVEPIGRKEDLNNKLKELAFTLRTNKDFNRVVDSL